MFSMGWKQDKGTPICVVPARCHGQNGVMRPRRVRKGHLDWRDETEGRVKTLPIPAELDIDKVETINLDQSQVQFYFR